MKKKTARKRPAVNKVYYIYVGILATLFFIFHTIPFLRGVLYSFTDWKGYGDWNFVGLRNYLHSSQMQIQEMHTCSLSNLQ